MRALVRLLLVVNARVLLQGRVLGERLVALVAIRIEKGTRLVGVALRQQLRRAEIDRGDWEKHELYFD